MDREIIYQPKPKDEYWGTGCVIVQDGKVLLGLRSDNNTWGTPGGGVEDGETPLDGIIREVKEETGLDVNPFFLKFVKATYSSNEKAIWTSFIFVCSRVDGELKPQPGEIEELRWVPVSELQNYNLFTPTKESLMIIMMYHPQYLLGDLDGILNWEHSTHPIDGVEYLPLLETYIGKNSTLVNKIYDVYKMTSVEQLLSVKNPGRNGGSGFIGTDGNWHYTKPERQGVNRAALQNQKSSKLQLLKQSYIQYFQNLKEFKKIYSVQGGKFVFPTYNEAIQQGLVKDKQSYMRLFKEQFVHFELSKN